MEAVARACASRRGIQIRRIRRRKEKKDESYKIDQDLNKFEWVRAKEPIHVPYILAIEKEKKKNGKRNDCFLF